MRKQGELYFKIITIVLAAVIGAYAVIALIASGGRSGYTMESAVLCEVGDGITVSGFVVRSERILSGSETIVVPERSEGEWVGRGQTVATGYTNARALENRQEQSRLQRELSQLEGAAEGLHKTGERQLYDQIEELLLEISAYAARGNYDAIKSTATELEPLILRADLDESDQSRIQDRIFQIRERIKALEDITGVGTVSINAPAAGYYSAVVDGYEGVLTPERILAMSVEELRQIPQQRQEPGFETIGRLITNQEWYYAAEIPAQAGERVEKGDWLSVSLGAQGLENLRMQVEYVSEAQDGARVLVLSENDLTYRTTDLREQRAVITFETTEGLRVPKQAIYYIEGQTGVYVLEGARAEWKEVNILLEHGDYYVAQWDNSDVNHLWPGDGIILTSKDIYDGKVMQ